MKLKGNRLRLISFLLFSIFLSQQSCVAASTEFYPSELKTDLLKAYQAKGKDYRPRTEHLLADGEPAYINSLIVEDSPYLLQHAHNPVHWHAWGEAAFAKAREQNKPIFLSIGYSTCHWCHVMERESFENTDIAKVLNEHFINIKVDRERRPDVDAVYMTAVQLITGSGGWPMSSFLTHEGKTFIGGTYFPPDIFKGLLLKVNTLWQQQQPLILEQAEKIALAVNEQSKSADKAGKIDQTIAEQALSKIISSYDTNFGGFGVKPKFPNETWLLYLLEFSRRTGNQQALAVVEGSLKAMARGGIYDHVGGGFHRYATDQNWLVPHFEKMLYNQALLARAYLLAYQLTGDNTYVRVAKQTLDYVLRDMTTSEGALYSASDADSDTGEGVYFLWTPAQIDKALNADDAKLAKMIYGVTEAGNFEHSNILNLAVEHDVFAQQQKTPLADLYQQLDKINSQLLKHRQQRVPPFRDDKVLVSWNAMMINTLAVAADILQQPRYLKAAQSAAEFIWRNNRQDNGDLWRVNLKGKASVNAVSEDYAYLAEAYIKLYDVSAESLWLERAQVLADLMIVKFWDVKAGGFYMNTASDSGNIMVRPKSAEDSTLPSANAAALRVLSALSKRLPEPKYTSSANATLAAFSNQIIRAPIAYTSMLLAATELNSGESGAHQYVGRGAVKVSAVSERQDKLQSVNVDITIRPGWHINSHQPLQDYLIATTLETVSPELIQLGEIKYPKPEIIQLGFQRESLSLYQQHIQLRVPIIPVKTMPRQLDLRIKIQACDDKICLPPESLILNIPAGRSRGL